jgi:hypothetical protein
MTIGERYVHKNEYAIEVMLGGTILVIVITVILVGSKGVELCSSLAFENEPRGARCKFHPRLVSIKCVEPVVQCISQTSYVAFRVKSAPGVLASLFLARLQYHEQRIESINHSVEILLE